MGTLSQVVARPMRKTSPEPLDLSAAAYRCTNCGISFSSPRNLAAHSAYYCTQRLQRNHQPSQNDHSHLTTTGCATPTTRPNNGPSEKATSQTSVDRKLSTSSGIPLSVSPPLCSDMIVSCPSDNAGLLGHKRSLSPDSSGADERPASKSPRLSSGLGSTTSERIFACPHCTYTTDRKGSLTRHLRVHVLAPDEAIVPAVAAPAAARYCIDCDIQFSTLKTYTVHKQFYCNTRTVQKQEQLQQQVLTAGGHTSASSSPGLRGCTPPAGLPSLTGPGAPVALTSITNSKPVLGAGAGGAAATAAAPQLANQPLFAAISTNPLVLIPCAFVPGSGLVPVQAGGADCVASLLSPGASAQLSPHSSSARDGDEPLTEISILPDRPPTTPRDSDQDSVATSASLADLKESGRKTADAAPLDLSTTPKKDCSRDDAGTPGSKRATPIAQDVDLATDLTNNSSTLKQGSLLCGECGISFHKAENLAAHRKHYCIGRTHSRGRSRRCSDVVDDAAKSAGRDLGPAQALSTGTRTPSPLGGTAGGQGEGRASATPTPAATPCGPNTAQTPQPTSILAAAATAPQPVFQFYCIACGIKFTSLNNLQAHQTYYCPKRELLQGNSVRVGVLSRPVAELQCPRCRLAFPGEELLRSHTCSARKCPYCDVYCASHSAAQRHLATHAGIKAFKCTLCGYKGHTLRGMRTHVRVHVDKGALVHEEKFIVCVGENGEPIPPPPSGANIVHFLAAKSPALEGGDLAKTVDRPDKTSVSKEDVREEATVATSTLNLSTSATPASANISTSTHSSPSSAETQREVTSRNADAREPRNRSPPSREDSQDPSSKESPATVHAGQSSNPASGPDSPAKPEMHHWCNFCGYSSSYKGNVVRHIKLIHRDVLANGIAAAGQMGSLGSQTSSLPSAALAANLAGLPQAALAAAAAAHLSAAQLSAMNELLSLRNNNELVKRLRIDSDDENALHSNGDFIPKDGQSRGTSPEIYSEGSASTKVTSAAVSKSPSTSPTDNALNNDRHCSICNISFNYTSSYIAHKKFYCKAVTGGDGAEASPADASRAGTPVAQGGPAPCQTASV